MATIEQTPGELGAGAPMSAELEPHDPAPHGEETHTGVANAKLGMWLFLASDSLTFGALLFAYSYGRI